MRRWLLLLLPLLLLAADGAEQLDVPGLRAEASSLRIESDLRVLSGAVPLGSDPLLSRNIHHPDHDRAQAWLREQLQAIEGLQVRDEPFDAEGEQNANLIADLPGRGESPQLVIVGAHYDSTASLEEFYDPQLHAAPGADDDGSGVSAVLEIARLLSAWEGGFDHTLRFLLFDAEEEGLLGSYHHVEQLDGDVRLMASLDPIGFNAGGGDRVWFAYDARWTEEADALEQTAADLGTHLLVAGVDADLIGGDARSDHYPFWAAGLPALHVGTFPQPPAYHTPDDTFDVVDLVFLREVTGLLAAHFAEVAGPRPFEPDAGRGCN